MPDLVRIKIILVYCYASAVTLIKLDSKGCLITPSMNLITLNTI